MLLTVSISGNVCGGEWGVVNGQWSMVSPDKRCLSACSLCSHDSPICAFANATAITDGVLKSDADAGGTRRTCNLNPETDLTRLEPESGT